MVKASYVGVTIAIILSIVAFFLATASEVHALGKDADAICVVSQCDMPKRPRCPMVTCGDVTNGFPTGGKCANMFECKAQTAGGQAVGLDQVAKILGDLMSKLMQNKTPTSAAPPPPPPTGSTGCTETIQVSDIAQLQGNPCARYVPPPVSGQLSGADQLSGALGGSEQAADLSGAILGNVNSNANTATNLSTSILTTAPAVSVPKGFAGLVPTLPGVFGDIKLFTGGATIVAGTRSEQQNTEISGFYGSGSSGGQPQSLVGQWCQSRPWALNFLSFIVPPTFFDSLCTWRGYQVGTPPPPQKSPSLQQTTIKASTASTTTTSTPTSPAFAPKVDIWAVPAAVPLGARTTIFWNTQGVTNCTETSPDGSFNQNSLSGGAATVPITGATTFSISCDAPDGSHVTGYVIVNLAI